MFEVKKQIHFCYSHRLLKHPGKCSRYHGHNAIAEITCFAKELDDNQMVIDFDEITSQIKTWINDTLDHRSILNSKDSLAKFLDKEKENPIILDREPTAEVIAEMIFCEAKRKKLPILQVELWETPTSSALYRE